MSRRTRLLTALLFAWNICVVAYAYAQTPLTEDHRPVSPELWFVVAGCLVTVGINLEQLRRCRMDVKGLTDKGEKRDETLRSMDHRLQYIEDALKFLKTRPDVLFGPQHPLHSESETRHGR